MSDTQQIPRSLYDMVSMCLPYYPQVLIYVPSTKASLRDYVSYFNNNSIKFYDANQTAVITYCTGNMKSPWNGKAEENLRKNTMTTEELDLDKVISSLELSDNQFYVLVLEDIKKYQPKELPQNIVGVIGSPSLSISSPQPIRYENMGDMEYGYFEVQDSKALELKWVNIVKVFLVSLLDSFSKDYVGSNNPFEGIKETLFGKKNTGITTTMNFLKLAFTHKSFNINSARNYEIQEFIGDAWLKSIFAAQLLTYTSIAANESVYSYAKYKFMSKSEQAKIAEQFQLNRYVRGYAVDHSSASLKEDILESIFGAMYMALVDISGRMDYPILCIWSMMNAFYKFNEETMSKDLINKTRLPEVEVNNYMSALNTGAPEVRKKMRGGVDYYYIAIPEIYVKRIEGRKKEIDNVRLLKDNLMAGKSIDEFIIANGLIHLSGTFESKESAWESAEKKLADTIGLRNIKARNMNRTLRDRPDLQVKLDVLRKKYDFVEITTMTNADSIAIFLSLLVGYSKDSYGNLVPVVLDREPGGAKEGLVKILERVRI